MKIENDYPKIKKSVRKFIKFRTIMLYIFLVSIVTCVIINLSIGGKNWMFYVIGAEAIFYFAFLNKPLIDNIFIKRITVVILYICAYLYMIDLIEKTSWSYFVIGIIMFSMIILQIIIFFAELNSKNKKFIPMFFTAVGSIIFCLLAIIKVVKINWTIIVLGSLGFVSLIIVISFYRLAIFTELKKYFSIK